MKLILFSLLFFSFFTAKVVSGQKVSIDKGKFFEDTSVINATIETDMVKVFREKDKTGAKFPAHFSATLPDSTKIDMPIVLEIRGHFRKDFCYLPPLKVIFKNKKAPELKSLGSLKLVSQCKTSNNYQQYLLSEFYVYKMYNLLTDKSFRVRLLNLNLIDSTGRKKTINEYAFLMEDEKGLAKRNNCSDFKKDKVDYHQTNRKQMTLVAIFEYMIGNTDWGVSVNHNTRLLLSKNDSSHLPYVVPYDFDYSGFVNTDYAIPDPKLDITSVRDRLYRGFPRTIDEINEALNIFKKQEKNIYSLINDCSLLTSRTKKDLTGYLDGFFSMIKKPNEVYNIFVQNARSE
jgi:hypothetical protein